MEKNDNLSPYLVGARCNKKVWWRCQKDHEWQATPGNRFAGTGCPFCEGRRLSPEHNLAVKYPELAKEWHSEKNGSLTPHDVTPKSTKKIWWHCKNNVGHAWEAKIQNRVSSGRKRLGTGCPDCAGRRVSAEHNLAIQRIDLANEWHPTKNGTLTPYEVTPKANIRVWWLCQRNKNHEWQANIQARNAGTNCPFCFGRKSSKEYNLAIICPQLPKEWHPEKNHGYFPEKFTPGSQFKAWWKCERNHEWKATIRHRVKGIGCPKCNPGTSKLEIRIFCELSYLFPDIKWQEKICKQQVDIFLDGNHKFAIEVDSKYWHKNRIEKDKEKFKILKSNNIALFRVREKGLQNDNVGVVIGYKKGEEELSIIKRLINVLIENINFSSSDLSIIKNYLYYSDYKNEIKYQEMIDSLPGPIFEKSVANIPKLIKQWDFDKNYLNPERVHFGSNYKAWWHCEKNHIWKATIGSRYAGRNCPQCARKIPSITNNLSICCPSLAEEWHPTKNNQLTPEEFTPKSQKKVWWMCKKNHEWQAKIGNRFYGNQCPYCSGRKAFQNYNLSVTNPELVAEWHQEKNSSLTPYDVTPKSLKKVWWKCRLGHIWETAVSNRAIGHGCHYCSGQKATAHNNLAVKRPDLLKEWDYLKNTDDPFKILCGSSKKVFWICLNGHTWAAQLKSRTKLGGTGCPECFKNKRKSRLFLGLEK